MILTPPPKMQFIGDDGLPLAGGKVYTYAKGTTTPLATYTTSAGGTANANPVILDAEGRAAIWVQSLAYTFSVLSAIDVLQGCSGDLEPPTFTLQTEVDALEALVALKANIDSPALTGIPTAPTAAVGTNTTQIATTAFVLANSGGKNATVSGLNREGGIDGGDITRVNDTTVSVGKTSCKDSTGLVDLSLSAATNVTLKTGANAFSEIFIVRLLNGTCSALCYATEAAAAADTATINAYRWLGEWLNTGAGSVAIQGIQVGPYMHRGAASESVLSTAVGVTPATVDHTAQLNPSRVELIEYGCMDASTVNVLYAIDNGSNLSFLVGTTGSVTGDTSLQTWGESATQKCGMKPYLAGRKFGSTGSTIDLLVQAVKWRR